MRIGLIVDGQAEFRSLASLFPRIETSATIFNPLYADIQPHSKPTKIVRATLPAIRIFARRGADRVILCIDHENRSECIPAWRNQLETALASRCAHEGVNDARVALKAAMFENWLVSDTSAFTKKKARFNLTQAHVNQIAPNKADSVDAARILKSAAIKIPYHKINDAVSLMSVLDPYACATNSRSFRRFLRLLSCQHYAHQSRAPA